MSRSKLFILVLLSIIVFATLTLTSCDSISYVNNEHQIDVDFNNIAINTDTADIHFVLSADDICRVACYESANERHVVEVVDDTLVVKVDESEKWYENINFSFTSPKITVYLPKTQYASFVVRQSTGDVEISSDLTFYSMDISLSTGDVKCYASVVESIKIEASTGDIFVQGVSATSLNIEVSTGKVSVCDTTCNAEVSILVSTGKASLTDVVCKNVFSTGTTGDIKLKNVVCSQNISIKRSTGDVFMEDSDAAELFISTNTGDVKGNLLTSKIFYAQSDTGRINVP
ncbi:MAG: DUF4097 family beta strand repeat protein, partial [Clostridia bacterium]|nr:DUF4097 family beta strand repeat protein [Clostridia bacterium]